MNETTYLSQLTPECYDILSKITLLPKGKLDYDVIEFIKVLRSMKKPWRDLADRYTHTGYDTLLLSKDQIILGPSSIPKKYTPFTFRDVGDLLSSGVNPVDNKSFNIFFKKDLEKYSKDPRSTYDLLPLDNAWINLNFLKTQEETEEDKKKREEKNKIEKRRKLLALNFEGRCRDTVEPFSQEEYGDMEYKDLMNMIVLKDTPLKGGDEKEKGRCYNLDQLYYYIMREKKKGKTLIKDPSSPWNNLSNSDIQTVISNMIQRNPGLEEEVRDLSKVADLELRFFELAPTPWWAIQLYDNSEFTMQGGADTPIMQLGFIPNVTLDMLKDPKNKDEYPSKNQETSEIIRKINAIFYSGKLMTSITKKQESCCTIGLNKTKAHWYKGGSLIGNQLIGGKLDITKWKKFVQEVEDMYDTIDYGKK